MEKEGYKIKRAQEYFAQMESNAGNLIDIAFMFVDQDTFNKVKASGNEISIADRKFIIPSLLHLIALKLHSIKNNPIREITDFPDVARLIASNAVDVNKSEFKELCLRYGTEELCEKLRRYA